MSLSTYSLATVAELKAFRGGEVGNEADPSFEMALNAASALVEGYLDRQVVTRPELTEFHTVSSELAELYLLEWPIISVTNVYEDATRTYATALTVDSDYIVSKPTGKIIRVGGAAGGLQLWTVGFRSVKVLYTAGYAQAEVPAHIKDVVCWVAAHLYQESERKGWDVYSSTDGAGTMTRMVMSRLPGYMKEQLDLEKRAYKGGKTGERDS